jgi:hypothetical protein
MVVAAAARCGAACSGISLAAASRYYHDALRSAVTLFAPGAVVQNVAH